MIEYPPRRKDDPCGENRITDHLFDTAWSDGCCICGWTWDEIKSTWNKPVYWYELDQTGHFGVYGKLDDAGRKLLLCVVFKEPVAKTIVKALSLLHPNKAKRVQT